VPSSGAVGARIEAPTGVECGEGVSPSPLRKVSEEEAEGAKIFDLGSQKANFGANWVLFVQFT